MRKYFYSAFVFCRLSRRVEDSADSNYYYYFVAIKWIHALPFFISVFLVNHEL